MLKFISKDLLEQFDPEIDMIFCDHDAYIHTVVLGIGEHEVELSEKDLNTLLSFLQKQKELRNES